MKKLLYLLSGLAWGIFVSNQAILWYAIFLSAVTIFVDIAVDEK